jgi:hypothetical protein
MRGLALLIGVVAALLALLLIVGVIELPQNVQSLLEPIPIKFILVEIGIVLIVVMAMFVYWSSQLPRAARVALDLFRACLGFYGGLNRNTVRVSRTSEFVGCNQPKGHYQHHLGHVSQASVHNRYRGIGRGVSFAPRIPCDQGIRTYSRRNLRLLLEIAANQHLSQSE